MVAWQRFNLPSSQSAWQTFGVPRTGTTGEKYWVPHVSAATADEIVGGGQAWATPTNAAIADGNVAKVELGVGGTSRVLKANNFGFAGLGNTDTIHGIVVGVLGRIASSGPSCSDLRIVNPAGTAIGTDRSAELVLPIGGAGVFGNMTVGEGLAVSANWGIAVATLTGSDLKHANFGVQLVFSGAGDAVWTEIDHIYMSVRYSPA